MMWIAQIKDCHLLFSLLNLIADIKDRKVILELPREMSKIRK